MGDSTGDGVVPDFRVSRPIASTMSGDIIR
jgi:hypothetical protein